MEATYIPNFLNKIKTNIRRVNYILLNMKKKIIVYCMYLTCLIQVFRY